MRTYCPFTERVLDRLPGPRWAAMIGWALLAPTAYLLGHLADPGAPYPGDAFVVTFAWIGVVGLRGASIAAVLIGATAGVVARAVGVGLSI